VQLEFAERVAWVVMDRSGAESWNQSLLAFAQVGATWATRWMLLTVGGLEILFLWSRARRAVWFDERIFRVVKKNRRKYVVFPARGG
jgi:hypothetical protein